MELIRKLSKPTAILLAFYLLILSGPLQSAWAAMIDSESIINLDRSRNARDYLNNLLLREDIQTALVAQGIDAQEAMSRIASLSDAEVNHIAAKLDRIPAGGGAGVLETLLIAVFLVFLILLITDLTGYTDVFPFIKKNK